MAWSDQKLENQLRNQKHRGEQCDRRRKVDLVQFGWRIITIADIASVGTSVSRYLKGINVDHANRPITADEDVFGPEIANHAIVAVQTLDGGGKVDCNVDAKFVVLHSASDLPAWCYRAWKAAVFSRRKVAATYYRGPIYRRKQDRLATQCRPRGAGEPTTPAICLARRRLGCSVS